MNGGPTCRSEPSEDRFVQRYSGIDCDRKIKIASGAEAVTKIRKINAIDFLTAALRTSRCTTMLGAYADPVLHSRHRRSGKRNICS
jgi:hypothetical protein